jgi:glycosyltransferase involved in cell wall biosynthesis
MKKKVIVLAEVCNPEWASLPAFSYALVDSLSKYSEIIVVTHIRNKDALTKEEHKLPFEVIFIDNEKIAAKVFKFGNFLGRVGLGGFMTQMALSSIPYIFFERMAYKKLKSRIEQGEFNIAVRISPVSPTIPSPFASLASLPFILGPINGGLKWPKGFSEVVKKDGEVVRSLRKIYRIFPYYRSMYRNTNHILASFSHVLPDIPKEHHEKIEYFDELGVYSENFKPLARTEYIDKCVFIFVGRLVALKCVDVLISAFGRNEELREKCILRVIGDGPEKDSLDQMVGQLNLQACVFMEGWKNQEEVADAFSKADVFAFPTIREAGGNVILEAMSAGLPCLVPNYGGPSELVDDKTGIRMDLSTKAKLVDEFENAMLLMVNDEQMRESMSKAARQKAENEFDWTMKGKRLSEICQKVSTQKPR